MLLVGAIPVQDLRKGKPLKLGQSSTNVCEKLQMWKYHDYQSKQVPEK